MNLSFLRLCVLGSAATLMASCSMFDSTCDSDDQTCFQPLLPSGIGGECNRDAECRTGLDCVSGHCEVLGNGPEGTACAITMECSEGLFCGSDRTCQPAGDSGLGEPCMATADCETGLACGISGLSAGCVETGSGDIGAECGSNGDCLAGLSCLTVPNPLIEGDAVPRCHNPPASDFEIPSIPFWAGTECEDELDDARAFFEVPRGDVEEFYRLPFPNDIRRKGGGLDLSGHPTPPTALGIPIVERYIEVAQEDLDGFATNAVVYFRFSKKFNFESVSGDTVRIVDITPGSPGYDRQESLLWKTTAGDLSNYICPNWLAIKRPIGQPLRGKTTYAAIVTSGVRPDDGGTFARDADLDAMLGSSSPSDGALGAAHTAYAPLRAWIADTGQDSANIINAAVFTTQDPEEQLPLLRGVITADGKPTVTDTVACDSGVTSPCDDGNGRGECSSANGEFTEIHGRINLAMFQQGTLPYEEPEDGGGISVDGAGNPIIANHRDVCFALSVPKTAKPSGGWPLTIYAHGTGGSFTGQMGSGGYASVAATGGSPAALLAIDMPQHGDRRGDSDRPEDELFFNFLNPRAARDNVLQGSADVMSLVLWAVSGGLSAGESPTGDAVNFDGDRIMLFGHSQGSTHTSLMVSYEPDASAVILSGNGGHLTSSLLTKSNPIDIQAVLPFALLDPDSNGKLAGGSYNPVLALFQSVFERTDPINFAHRFHLEPTAEAPNGHHVFTTYGIGDTFSTEETLTAYNVAGEMPHVTPVLNDLGLATVDPPASGNVVVNGAVRTIGMRQYTPNGVDGHFVASRDGQPGFVDTANFMQQVMSGETPTIGQ